MALTGSLTIDEDDDGDASTSDSSTGADSTSSSAGLLVGVVVAVVVVVVLVAVVTVKRQRRKTGHAGQSDEIPAEIRDNPLYDEQATAAEATSTAWWSQQTEERDYGMM